MSFRDGTKSRDDFRPMADGPTPMIFPMGRAAIMGRRRNKGLFAAKGLPYQRPSADPQKWRPQYADVIFQMTVAGSKDSAIAAALGVSLHRYREWTDKNYTVQAAIRRAKQTAGEVAAALLDRARGYVVQTEKVFLVDKVEEEFDATGARIYRTESKEVMRVPTYEHIPADVRACETMLKRLEPDVWRDAARGETPPPSTQYNTFNSIVLTGSKQDAADAYLQLMRGEALPAPQTIEQEEKKPAE